MAFIWTAPLSVTDYTFTTDGTTPAGYGREETTGWLHPTSAAGRVGLQRWVNASTGVHYYTTVADAPAGFTLESTLGYVETSGGGGGTVLSRDFHAATGVYVLTTAATPPAGWTRQASVGYLHTGTPTEYVRNALGQVVVGRSPAVTYTYAYDGAHRLRGVTDSRGGKTLEYWYSPGGLLNAMRDSDGQETDYVYDGVGRLVGIWAPNGDVISFSHDAGGRLTEKWFPNGVTTRYSYHRDNTLAQVVNRSSAGIVSQHDYTYNEVGNRYTHTEVINGTSTPYRYVYDPLDRLIEVRNHQTSALLESYGYDPLGNRTAKTAGGGTLAYVYDGANQLTEIWQGSTLVGGLVYDANGNVMKKCEGGAVTRTDLDCSGATVLALGYDALNRLTQASKTGLAPETYGYDGDGRRIRKMVGSTTTEFLFSGPDIVGEYTSWASPVATYTHGPNMDDPLLRATGTTAQYYHQDGLGSVVAFSGPAGTTDATARYNAWGVRQAFTGILPLYGYTGREPDDTGLIYYRARYYDPALGRFVQRDPIGMSGGVNPYVYVLANPVNLTDPLGLTPREAAAGLLADASQSYHSSVSDAPSSAYSGLNLGTRALGALKVAGGLVEAGLTLPLCPGTGIACLGVAHGLDVGAAGLRQIFSGQPESSITGQALGRVLDPFLGSGTGQAIDAGMSAGFTLGGSLATSAPAALPAARAGSSVALNEAQAANLGRFQKDLPRGAGEVRIHGLADGTKVFEARVSAKNIPGSYAIYEKQVDSAGRTILFRKTTVAPDGTLIHIKVK